MKLPKIKPCPFCGKEANIFIGIIRPKSYGVSCDNVNCKIQPYTQLYHNKRDAIEAWNIRPKEE